MNYNFRIKKLTIFFSILTGLLILVSAYRMIWQKDSLSRKVYRDKPMMTLIEDLARDGIIKPGKKGKGVSIDEARLKISLPNRGYRQFVLDRVQYMSFDGDSLVLDPAALSVTNRRLIRKAVKVSRGGILDRSGQVLAKTVRKKNGTTYREYTLGPACFPLLGISHPVYGQKGLERSLNIYLEGNAKEGLLRRLYRFFSGKRETYDVMLTIDKTLQETAFKALGDNTGAVIVLDVETGEILAAASTPSFDPSQPPGPDWDIAEKKGYKGPFINRAFQRHYPPGSTFKLVTAAAWMEQPDFNIKWGIECGGWHRRYNIREHRNKRHGWVSLKTAVTMSCNVFFAEVGPRLGSGLCDYAERFGFNQKFTLMDGESEKSLVIPSRAFRGHPDIRAGKKWEHIDFKRNPRLVAQAAVGQNTIEATPLQMAMIGAAIANNGQLMAPRLIKHVKYVTEGKDNQNSWLNYKSIKPRIIEQVCREKTAHAILSMMASVMDKGTAYRLKKIYYQNGIYKTTHKLPPETENVLVGKTGTAETGRDMPDHSWFLSIAPLEQPRYSVAVIVEHGGLGAKVAGPIAVNVMTEALNIKN